jgi:hypothetical protein
MDSSWRAKTRSRESETDDDSGSYPLLEFLDLELDYFLDLDVVLHD